MYEVPAEMSYDHSRIFNSIDDDYILVAAHVDLATEKKIIAGEFVDFAKLIPNDKLHTEDHRMELVSKGGMTYLFLFWTGRLHTLAISTAGKEPSGCTLTSTCIITLTVQPS